MEQTAVEKKFGKYVMASMITMFLQSAYSMIDGLFVSNLIGDTALSAYSVILGGDCKLSDKGFTDIDILLNENDEQFF